MKKKAGQPTKFKPEYCEQLISHMDTGYSFESFAAVINVDRDTLYNWARLFPEFSDAKKKAFDKCLYRWESIGIAGVMGVNKTLEGSKIGQFNAGAWIFNMKNRFNWRDKQEHVGKDGERLTIAQLVAEVAEDEESENDQ